MCKILLIGNIEQDLDLKSVLGDEEHTLTHVSSYEKAKNQILNNGYFDMIIASPCLGYERTTEILKHVRTKSSEAQIIVVLDRPYSNVQTWEWIKTLTEEVGVDLFIPENASPMIKVAITNAATRMKQRSLGPQFEELANRILNKLS